MDNTWEQIANARLGLATYLSHLPASAWLMTSDRTHWSIKQLASHIVLEAKYNPWIIAKDIVRARFDINHFMDLAARRYAVQHHTHTIVGELQTIAYTRRRPLFISPNEVLIDLWIHTLDIYQASGFPGKLDHQQTEYILHFIKENPRSHGLRVMGVAPYLQKYRITVSDYNDVVIGYGQHIKKVTAAELFRDLIGLKIS